MSQTETRQWLAEQLAELQIQGVNVYRYAVESPSVPCVMLADGEPIVELHSVGANTCSMNLRIVCIVPMLDAEASQQMLEVLTDMVLEGLPRDRVQFASVGSTATLEVGEYMYYSRDLPVTLKYRLGE